MPSCDKLKNLVKIGTLKEESSTTKELQALIESGRTRLKDSENKSLSLESRFDLSYNAAHSLALAALRKFGYRASNRLSVFQCLEHTSRLTRSQIRILIDAHGKRNQIEYDGDTGLGEKLVEALIETTKQLLAELE